MSEPIRYEPKKSASERMKDHLTASEEAVKAAVHNEMVTRARMESLHIGIAAFVNMSFRNRLKWLLFGPPKAKPEPVSMPFVQPEEPAKEGPDVH